MGAIQALIRVAICSCVGSVSATETPSVVRDRHRRAAQIPIRRRLLAPRDRLESAVSQVAEWGVITDSKHGAPTGTWADLHAVRFSRRRTTWAATLICMALANAAAIRSAAGAPIAIERQGAFAVGGTVIGDAENSSLHCDHGVVEYQIPPRARA